MTVRNIEVIGGVGESRASRIINIPKEFWIVSSKLKGIVEENVTQHQG